MSSFITEEYKKRSDFHMLGSVDGSKIENAENTLCVKFSPEYREYVKECGIASFAGHEFTGICKSQRLNVVDVTIEERNNSKNTENMYVIERLDIDGIVTWQDSRGKVYQLQDGEKPKEVSNSIKEYLAID